MKITPILIVALSMLISTQTSLADTLLINLIEKEPSNSTEGVLRPQKGQTMQYVETTFGAPTNTSAAIGNPPITRWYYEKFTVYFENTHVIHSVLKKPTIAHP